MTDSAHIAKPLLRFGFRPFFLSAAFWALFSALLWMVNLFGFSGAFIGGTEMPAMLWHGHEMIFGFVFAVIAGFLLTASAHWTGINPAKGAFLAFLVFCWAAGRILFYGGALLPAMCADLVFDFGLMLAVARVIFKARLLRNAGIALLLSLSAFLNLFFYLIEIFRLSFDPVLPLEGGLAVFTFFVLLIAGRIIPVFAPNAIAGLTLKPAPLLNKFSPLSGLFALGFWCLSPAFSSSSLFRFAAAFVFFAAAICSFLRLLRWKPAYALKNSMIFMLYAAYGWLVFAFLLMDFELFQLVPRSMTVHAMALGVIATAIAAMMCRVTLGHTGRLITAQKVEIFFFTMISLSALLRLISALPAIIEVQNLFLALLFASATCFILGFAAFLYRYGPFLCQNRADGKIG